MGYRGGGGGYKPKQVIKFDDKGKMGQRNGRGGWAQNTLQSLMVKVT